MITTDVTTDLVRGVAELEPTARGGVRLHRLPAWARAQTTDPQLAMAQAQPAGARVAFRTGATRVELDVVATKRVYPGAPPRPDGVHELSVDGEVTARTTVDGGDTITLDLATGQSELRAGTPSTIAFDAARRRARRRALAAAQRGDRARRAPQRRPARSASPNPSRWLHHGSSISHGSNAATPTGTWPAVAARLGGVDLLNLGLGGSALLDPFVARIIRDTPADLISLKLGINLVNLDVMRLRAFGPAVHGFLDTIRDGHPDTPLLLVSPIFCAHPRGRARTRRASIRRRWRRAAPLPRDGRPRRGGAPGKLTLEVIRRRAGRSSWSRRDDDPNLHLPRRPHAVRRGRRRDAPLPDALHPDAATHRLIGERFAAAVFGAGGPSRAEPRSAGLGAEQRLEPTVGIDLRALGRGQPGDLPPDLLGHEVDQHSADTLWVCPGPVRCTAPIPAPTIPNTSGSRPIRRLSSGTSSNSAPAAISASICAATRPHHPGERARALTGDVQLDVPVECGVSGPPSRRRSRRSGGSPRSGCRPATAPGGSRR